NGNYQIAGVTTALTANITPAQLTVSGLTANDKVYNGTLAATLSGTAVLAGTIYEGDGVSLSGSASSGSFADPNIGTSKPVSADLSGLNLSNGNYQIAGVTGQLLANITAATPVPAPVTTSEPLPTLPPNPVIVPAFVDNGSTAFASTAPTSFGGLNYVLAPTGAAGDGNVAPSAATSTLNFVTGLPVGNGDISTGKVVAGTSSAISPAGVADTVNEESLSAGAGLQEGEGGSSTDRPFAPVAQNAGQPEGAAGALNFVSSADEGNAANSPAADKGGRKNSNELNINDVTVPSATGPLDVFVVDTGINRRNVKTLTAIRY
ncbi:YDG domain-containing protein, partial [Vogesella indigofera]|uniref:YDG domain-containing protein n=1 Tax=Vogesella indigofera TaxID=45465 RepID=UPI00234ED170